jgi:DNA-binding PadR family transcriptional regulator
VRTTTKQGQPEREKVAEIFKKEIVQRITRNLLDIQVLRLIQTEPMWGYRIKRQTEAKFGVRLRHGALYPLLSEMERESLIIGENQPQGKRTRKVYKITKKGEVYLEAYSSVLKQQLEGHDLE